MDKVIEHFTKQLGILEQLDAVSHRPVECACENNGDYCASCAREICKHCQRPRHFFHAQLPTGLWICSWPCTTNFEASEL